MGKKLDDRAFEEIAELIREDKEHALELFRKGNFDQELRARVAAIPEGKRRPVVRGLLIPVSVVLLLLAAVAAVFLLWRRQAAGPLSGPGLISAVLGELPGVSELALPREPNPAGAMPAFGAARVVRTVLALAAREKEAEERKVEVPAGQSKIPRLSLEKKMEILFKDRAIERVLVSIFKKSEEV
jgi:hypothetical protein